MTTSRLDGRTKVVSSTTATAVDEDEDAIMLDATDELIVLDTDEAIVDEDVVTEEDIVDELIPDELARDDAVSDDDEFDFFESLLPPQALKIMTMLAARP